MVGASGTLHPFNYAGASSRLSSINYPSALTTTFGYYNTNGDLRLMGLTNSAGSTVLSRFNYAYNQAGQITNLIQQLTSGGTKTTQYGYDPIGELTSATNSSSSYNYGYDLAGNRTSESIGASTSRARFNPLNEIQSKDQGLSSTNRSFQWDEENRPVSISEGSVGTQIIYNGFGRKVYLTELNNGSVTMSHWYVWSGDKIAEEAYINTANSAYFHWYYDYGHYDSFNPWFVYTTRDGLGSPREYYTGIYNQTMWEYDYDPYGRQNAINPHVLASLVSLENYNTVPEAGFTGMLQTPGHNLYFAESREYDPDLGRWTSTRPDWGRWRIKPLQVCKQ